MKGKEGEKKEKGSRHSPPRTFRIIAPAPKKKRSGKRGVKKGGGADDYMAGIKTSHKTISYNKTKTETRAKNEGHRAGGPSNISDEEGGNLKHENKIFY